MQNLAELSNVTIHAIERFAAGDRTFSLFERNRLLLAAFEEIYALVEVAVEMRRQLSKLSATSRRTDEQIREAHKTTEFISAEQYVDHYAHVEELLGSQAALLARVDALRAALNYIAVLIVSVLPESNWFKYGDLAFRVDPFEVRTYDKTETRYRLVVKPWELRGLPIEPDPLQS